MNTQETNDLIRLADHIQRGLVHHQKITEAQINMIIAHVRIYAFVSALSIPIVAFVLFKVFGG